MLRKILKPCIIHQQRCCAIFTLSNVLTLSRIVAIPFLMLGIYGARWNFVFVLFVLTATTDLLDGYFARSNGDTTHLGAFLDPVADKLFIFSSFAALAFCSSPSFAIPTWFVYLLFLRESLMLIGGSILLTKQPLLLQPTIWGKLTTFFQILFIAWLFICYFFGLIPAKTYAVLLFLLAFFSVISFFHYTYRVFKAFLTH
jgi:cardiolipin synthase